MRFISPFGGEWWRHTRVSYLIIFANFVLWFVFLLGAKIIGYNFLAYIKYYLAISPVNTFQKFHIWTLVTYAFVHFDLWHVFFNMLIMMFFGPRVELDMGSRRFLRFYFICAVGGALISILAKTNTDVNHVTIGASGAVLGVLLAYGTMYPRDVIYIWGILPLRAWTLVVLITVLQFLMVFQSGMGGSVDYWAHIGGLGSAFLFLNLRRYSRRHPPSSGTRITSWRGEDAGEERTYYLEE